MLSFSVISCSYPPLHDTDYLQFDFRRVPFYFRTTSSVSANLRPFPSDFGHLRPFYSLQNRCIFIRFCRRTEACARWPRRLALRTGHALAFACHTKLRLFCGLKKRAQESQITWKHAETDASKRKLTISSWSRLFVLLVSENCMFLDDTIWFRTLASVCGRSRLFLNSTVRLRTLQTKKIADFRPLSDTCVPSWTVLTGFGLRFSDVLVRFQKLGPFS